MEEEEKCIDSNKEQQQFLSPFSDILSISSNPEDLFTLLYPIGHGGFGTVYKAIHNSTNRVVAIKIIDFIKNINTSHKDCNNKNICLNYYSVQQETSLMKLGNKSKYIVNYYGSYFSRKTSTLWLILEYCSSGSAIDLMIAMNRAFTEIEISTIMENVLQGLIIIHSMNLIHRDIKGANILLSEDGYAKLGDFGVGIRLTGEAGYRNSKKGSPYWMSPQVVKNNNYDMKTDIWSLGITCAELCNGEPPFSNLNPKNVMEKIAKFPPTVDEVIIKKEHTDEFYDFVKNCLEIDPKKRPSAKELIKHNFITKYSKGNKFLSELIFKHSEDINKFRKIISETNKNKNYFKYENKNHENDEINDYNYNLLDNIKENEEIKITLGQKNSLNRQSIYNESNFTSHFHNEGKLNEIQIKELLLLNNKIKLSSSNIDNYAISSTKDSQKNLKNNYSDKIIFISNSNNMISDSSSENNNQNYTTFHNMDNEYNDSNAIETEHEQDSEIIHHQCASFDKNYLFLPNENLKNNMNNKNIKNKFLKNNKLIYKPKLNNNNYSKLNVLYKNKKEKNSHYINKSTDNIFLNNNRNFNNLNFVYIKKRIGNNIKNNNYFQKNKLIEKNKINKGNIISYNKYVFNKKIEIKKGCISCRKKDLDLENIISDKDEEGTINKTNLFKTKSNYQIFNNDNGNIFGHTHNYFYRNKSELNEKNIFKSERNGKNNYSDLNEYDVKNIKYHINNCQIISKMHQKYFDK